MENGECAWYKDKIFYLLLLTGFFAWLLPESKIQLSIWLILKSSFSSHRRAESQTTEHINYSNRRCANSQLGLHLRWSFYEAIGVARVFTVL